jgi:hypothetical protein
MFLYEVDLGPAEDVGERLENSMETSFFPVMLKFASIRDIAQWEFEGSFARYHEVKIEALQK